MGNVELFDTHNRLNFPTEAQIAALPADAQKRFEGVRSAKAKLDAATKHRETVEQQIKDCDAARAATKAEMDSIRPRWTATDNAKAHIASEREQRRLERGY
jgi:predicted  nucleic acid-binding Zn-ribbon protein